MIVISTEEVKKHLYKKNTIINLLICQFGD